MSKVLFTNNAESRLDGAISAGATSFSIYSGDSELFPSPGTNEIAYVRIGTNELNEVVKITGRTGNLFACEAVVNSWDDETDVILTITAEALENFVQLDETAITIDATSGTATVSIKNGISYFEMSMDTAIAFSDFRDNGKECFGLLYVAQDSTGGWVLTFPSNIIEANNLSQFDDTAGNVNIFIWSCNDGATPIIAWYCSYTPVS